MDNQLGGERKIFDIREAINAPEDCKVVFLAKISDTDGYLAIYVKTRIGFDDKTKYCPLAEAKVVIGREEKNMTIIDVNYGQWLNGIESGTVEIEYDGKLISVSFSPEKGTYNNIPFEKIIDIS